MDYTYELRGVATRFFRFYNGHLYASDHAAPVYRHAVVAGLRGAPLPTGKSALAAPTTPPGAVARMTELAFELADFERAHKALHEERDVFRQIVATLEKDLDGHRKVLAEEREVRARLETHIAGLQGELRASLDSMRSVQEVLKQNDAKITELRGLLRGRWKNLKRALGPKRSTP